MFAPLSRLPIEFLESIDSVGRAEKSCFLRKLSVALRFIKEKRTFRPKANGVK